MKKLLLIFLALVMGISVCACGGGEDNSSEPAPSATVSDNSDASLTVPSDDNSKGTSSDGSDDPSDVSDNSSDVSDTSDEVSGDDNAAPEFISNFISVGPASTSDKATGTNAIRLTGIDCDLSYGSIVLYTDSFAYAAADFTEYVVGSFDYSGTLYGYELKSVQEIGSADLTNAFPTDGFIVAIHESQTLYIERLNAITETDTVFPHGIHFDNADYTASKLNSEISIDGNITDAEWGNYLIETIDSANTNWSYAQFTDGNYYVRASYYTAWDETNLYLAVVVDSPYHYCPVSQANAGDMWQYECIQVKVSTESPAGDYIAEHFDHVIDKTASNDKVIFNYGFAANDNGDTCYYGTEAGTVACVRDDNAQKTYYEVAIPFAEIGITPEAGKELGFTFSINSTNESDVNNKVWKNVTYRNGGGIIGRNDWSKIPVVTLG